MGVYCSLEAASAFIDSIAHGCVDTVDGVDKRTASTYEVMIKNEKFDGNTHWTDTNIWTAVKYCVK